MAGERPGARFRRGGALAAGAWALLAGCARQADTPNPAPEAQPAGVPGPSAADGQGRATLHPDDPVPCGSLGSWAIEWTAGAAGLPAGGAVVLQVSPFWGWTPPQTTDPGRPGYTTVTTTGTAGIATTEGAVPMTVIARVERGRLEPGESIRFTYGDSSRGGRGSLSRADMYAEDFERFLIKVDGDGDGVFGAIARSPSLRILAEVADRLAVAAPARATPGPLAVRVQALDARENRADPPAGRLEIRLRSLEGGAGGEAAPRAARLGVAERPTGDGWRLDARVENPGLYRLEATLVTAERADTLRGAADLLLVEADSTFAGILWGDIHCHSGLSDGTGTPEALYAYARDVAVLDVCAVTDHDAHGLVPLADGGWDVVKRATRAAYESGSFVTLLGYEWTSWTWGHRNVYYPGDAGDVFEFRAPESDTPAELWARIARAGGVTIPHHPAGGPIAVDWSVPSDEERERVVEICSIHGSSEFAGSDRAIYRPLPGAFVRDVLGESHRLGILASGDTHDGHPGRRTLGAPANGLAAFRTRERTREGVFAAIRDRRVYGTSGPRILLATDWDGRPPGADLPAWPAGPVVVRVAAPEPVQVVEIVAAGGVVARAWGGGRRAVHRFDDVDVGASPWAYVRVELGDGEVAWESPWWIRPAGERP